MFATTLSAWPLGHACLIHAYFCIPDAGSGRTLVRGDHHASTGSLSHLDLPKANLEQKFEMKTQMVGHSDRADVLREAKILNRMVRATHDGWEYKCDQRYRDHS